MPLIVQQHSLHKDSASYFAKVLADQPQLLERLAQVDENSLLIEAIFNGQPVALLLASKQADGCVAEALVVHPATRGRGVGGELLRKGSALLPPPVEWGEALRKLAEKFL